jgi:hypothetical protein
MKLVELNPDKYPDIAVTFPRAISCEVSKGGIVAVLHNRDLSSVRKQVFEVNVRRQIDVVSFDFVRGLQASQLTPHQVGHDLILQTHGGIQGFEVLRAKNYLSPEELEMLERISQIPNSYFVR